MENLPKNKMRNFEDDGRAGESRQCAKIRWMRKICRGAGSVTHELGGAGEPRWLRNRTGGRGQGSCWRLLEGLTESDLPRSRAGVRRMMRDRWVARIAASEERTGMAREISGAEAWPFRATFFVKSPSSNGCSRTASRVAASSRRFEAMVLCAYSPEHTEAQC